VTARRPRPATADDLLTKPARKKDVDISVPDDKGEHTVTLTLTSMSSSSYDALLAEHPPTAEQKKDGSGYNADTFAPALISAVVTAPKLSLEQATSIWEGETWSRGELRDLFMECVNLCNQGLNVPFKPVD
jgi:hypothetical protein